VSGDLSGFSMMELFRMEAESHTATLSAGLVALEGALAAPEVIEPLMRAAHSLKGAARIVGLDAAVRVAHAMEDCFVAAQKGKLILQPEHVDFLLRGVDLLAAIAQIGEAEVEAWQSEHAAAIDILVTELTAVQDGQVIPQAGPPPSVTHASGPEVPSFLPTPSDSEVADPADGDLREEEPSTPARSARSPSAPADRAENQGSERPAAEPAIPNRDRDRVVRVTAESLTRLMGLAGEALVQTHRLPPLVDALWQLKGRQTGLLESLQLLEDRLSTQGLALPAAEHELLNKSKMRAAQDLQRLGETVEAIEEFARVSEDVSSRLHHEVLTSRMRPLADGVRGFPRLVRDLARELGKQARFEVAGETTGVDRDILERPPCGRQVSDGYHSPGGAPSGGDAPDRPC
jgi:two-component system, chemotaxis family, sensor histidine kinase and response regulator WspE